MNKSIERTIAQIYSSVYKQVFNKSNSTSLSLNNKSIIESSLANLESSKKYHEFANKFATLLAQKGLRGQKGVWRKFYEAAKKARYIGLPKTWSAFEAKIMTSAIAHNFKMIKSIPQRIKEILHHKYTSALIEEVAKGNLPRGSFQKMLASHGHKQAKLIARTETAKLQTAILKNRATSLGSVAYIWMSSKDKRTRLSHQEMNGVVVFWRQDSEKPKLDNLQGDAGEYPNCRCTPQPIVDINDLTNSTYRVYDYRYHKIINMTRKELIEALQKGTL